MMVVVMVVMVVVMVVVGGIQEIGGAWVWFIWWCRVVGGDYGWCKVVGWWNGGTVVWV